MFCFKKGLLFLFVVAGGLMGCKNSSQDRSLSSVAEKSADQLKISAKAVATGTKLADEGGSFTVNESSVVRYGAGSNFVEKTISGSARCTNEFFGSDPYYGVAKACYFVSSSAAPANGTKLADEDQKFSVSVATVVQYGAGSKFVTKTVTGSAVCSNDFFGTDPNFGVAKACYSLGAANGGGSATPTPTPVPTATPSAPASGTKLADEDQNFFVSVATVVQYGAGSKFVTKTVTGSATCSNSFFGGDPNYGVAKACYSLGAANGGGSATPTPTPNPTPTPTPSSGSNSAGCGRTGIQSGAFDNQMIQVGSRTRSYSLIIPANYNPNEALPVLFNMHGNGGTAKGQREGIPMEQAPNAEKAIHIIPQGIQYQGNAIGWEEACGGYDQDFMKALVQFVETNYCVNTNRIFMTGFSWGGDMANAMGCCMGDVFRAVAPLSGGEMLSGGNCTSRISAYQLQYGTADQAYPQGLFQDILSRYRQMQGCQSSYTVQANGCREFNGCKLPVVECPIQDMGHQVNPNEKDQVWNFLSRFK